MSKINDNTSERYSLYKNCDMFYVIGYGLTQTSEDMYNWYELYFFKDKYSSINIDIIKQAVIKDIDSQTDKAILSGFVWNDTPVRLRQEDQFNFKAAYDLAYQTNSTSLPVKFKLGNTPIEWINEGTEEEPKWVETGGEPIYHTFEDMNEFTDFYTKAIAYINRCLDNGWQRKDSIDWSVYEKALNPQIEETVETEETTEE